HALRVACVVRGVPPYPTLAYARPRMTAYGPEELVYPGKNPYRPPSTSPNRTHSLPSKRCSCTDSIGAKSSAEVLMLMPGSSVSGRQPFMLAAWRITFSRVRLSPHWRSTWATVAATE